jgi:AcrR family transcriptional regulator
MDVRETGARHAVAGIGGSELARAGQAGDRAGVARAANPTPRARRAAVVAAADLIAERRSTALRTDEVVARAELSWRQFEANFDDIDECLVAAFEEALARVIPVLAGALPQDAAPIGRIRAALTALLAFLEDEPGWGHLLIVEPPSAVRERRERILALVAELIYSTQRAAHAGDADEVSRHTATRVVHELLDAVRRMMCAEHDVALTLAASVLMADIVVPALGPAALSPALTSPARPHVSRQLGSRAKYALEAILGLPGMSNRQVAAAAGIPTEANASHLLRRLERYGLIRNVGIGYAYGKANAWHATEEGRAALEAALARSTSAC